MAKDFIPSISVEKMAAYLDSNLTKEEMQMVQLALEEDPSLSGILEDLEVLDDCLMDDSNALMGNETLMDSLSSIDFNIPLIDESNIDGQKAPIDIEEHFNNNIMNLEELNSEDMEKSKYIENAHKQYGLEPLNILFDPDTYQWEKDTCAIRSQELVLRSYGIDISQEELIKEAEQNGWYVKGDGTSMEDVGNLLDLHNVPNHKVIDANVFNLVDELGQGHKVIVGVDLDELEGNSFWQSIKEFLVGRTPNHAMIVSGIDTSDPERIKVVLTDPGTGKKLFECPYDKFLSAWNDSSCFMVATDEPAPIEYNQEDMIHFNYERGHVPFLGKLPFNKYHDDVIPKIEDLLDKNVNLDDYLETVDRCIEDLELVILTDFKDPNLYDKMMDDFAESNRKANQLHINNINKISEMEEGASEVAFSGTHTDSHEHIDDSDSNDTNIDNDSDLDNIDLDNFYN